MYYLYLINLHVLGCKFLTLKVLNANFNTCKFKIKKLQLLTFKK